MRYKYCPECGAKLNGRQAGDDGLVPYCDNCKRYWFDSFSSCVIVMVVNELHEIALLKQSYISDQYETFVAGYITPGENAEEAATREVKEELGLTVENLIYEGTHWFDKREQLMHAYIGIVKKSPGRDVRGFWVIRWCRWVLPLYAQEQQVLRAFLL